MDPSMIMYTLSVYIKFALNLIIANDKKSCQDKKNFQINPDGKKSGKHV